MSYTALNRTVRSFIRLTYHPWHYLIKNVYRYAVDCMTHATPGPTAKRKMVSLHNHSHPWEWCQDCYDIFTSRKPSNPQAEPGAVSGANNEMNDIMF